MTTTAPARRIDNLVALLETLHELHLELLGIVQERIDAMKRADIAGMRDVGNREQALVQRISEREGLRKQLVDDIGRDMGMAPRAARAMSASQFAERIAGKRRGAVQRLTVALRETLARIARANQTSSMIAQGVLGHFRAIFESARTDDASGAGYGGSGKAIAEQDARIFDAVG